MCQCSASLTGCTCYDSYCQQPVCFRQVSWQMSHPIDDEPLCLFFWIFVCMEPWGWPDINNEWGHTALWTISLIQQKVLKVLFRLEGEFPAYFILEYSILLELFDLLLISATCFAIITWHLLCCPFATWWWKSKLYLYLTCRKIWTNLSVPKKKKEKSCKGSPWVTVKGNLVLFRLCYIRSDWYPKHEKIGFLASSYSLFCNCLLPFY